MMPRARGASGVHATNGAKPSPRSPKPSQGRKTAPSPLSWSDATVRMTPDGGWHFVLPIPVSANRRWRKGKGRIYKAEEAVAEDNGADLMFRRVVPLPDRHVETRLLWVRKGAAGDTDNRIKGTLDLLKGKAYADDKSVSRISIIRVDDPTERPRVEVIVTPCDAPTIREWRTAA